MIDKGYFDCEYEEASKHFAFHATILCNDFPTNPLEFANIRSKSEILRFCYFLRDGSLIDQNLKTVWTNFSYKNKPLPANLYALASFCNKHDSVPYELVKDTNLRILVKKFYSGMNQ